MCWRQKNDPESIAEKVDAPLLIVALVFAQMGVAESYRMRRKFAAADAVYTNLLSWHDQPPPGQPDERVNILCEFIEVPFIKLMKGLGSLERADNKYKSGALVEARAAYLKVFDDLSERDPQTWKAMPSKYVEMLNAGTGGLLQDAQVLLAKHFHPLALKEVPSDPSFPKLVSREERATYQILGKAIPALKDKNPIIVGRGGGLPGVEWAVAGEEALLKFAEGLKETNPLLWALVSEARSRLLQIEAGLNFLGYHPDYVPVARFQFLLDRARYFAGHAKSAERDYLNFRRSAEDENLKEITAAQGVALEKSNIQVEDARIDQTRLEAEAANQSKGLADLVSRNASSRRAHYALFNNRADALADDAMTGAWISAGGQVAGSALSGAVAGASLPVIGPPLGAVIGLVSGLLTAGGQIASQQAQLALAAEQRDLEYKNLGLALAESHQAATVAAAQLEVARQNVVIASLQRTAALTRHEFAVQNVIFLRERALNAELWYRLAELIRRVGQTYLRRAIELAFLAEQAYEFEADKKMNVIRFDYDVSETAGLLAGDFLLNDLDALEQDLVVNQRLRQQHVRYVVSLARDVPSALQQLRETGSAVFTLPLRQLEERFPGLYRLRIGSVDVLPVALMDPTRFSVELTYTGMSQIRVKGPSVATVGSTVASWLPALDGVWPVKLRLSGAQTVVFSGLTRADEQAAFPVIMASQRNAFEGEGAAASWYLDMSMRENQVDPRTVADVLVTFELSGYYDAALRNSLETAAGQRPSVLTQYLSGRQVFADAFYEFSRTGTMEWQVTGDMLSLTPPIGTARNVGIILPPTQRPPQFGRLMCTYRVTVQAADN